MEIKKVGVVGCGFMGSGITQVCAQSEYQVVVSEINDELLNKGLTTIDYYLTRSVLKGKISEQDKDSALARIKGTTNSKNFSDCDLVIEVVPENIDLKKEVFARIDKICPEHTILASNTSCISIFELAKATNRPEKVLGMHFLSPVPPSKLLEIVRSAAISDETLEIGKKFGESLGKDVIVAKDVPPFIFNRLLMALAGTAVKMLEDGIATKEDIDKSMTLGLSHPIGPIALLDFNGIDVAYKVSQAMYEQTKDPQYAPPALIRTMVETGQLGRKVGKGFYDYK